jgi:hypothetical protein
MPAAEAIRKLQLEPNSWTFEHGRGCEGCGYTGYSGRVGIFEILRLTPALKELVNGHSAERRLINVTRSAGVRFLLDDALAKVRAGLTTIEELLRVIRIEPGDFAAWESRQLRSVAADHLLPSAVRRAAKPRKRKSKSQKH